MADQRQGGIAWTDQTWNPVRGCSRVSEGCRHCYAEQVAARFSGPGQAYEGLARRTADGEARWTGQVRLVPEHLIDPLRWTRPRRIFVNSMSDLFHEAIPTEVLNSLFGIMACCRDRHTFQVLTKRAERMATYCADRDTPDRVLSKSLLQSDGRGHASPFSWPLPNVWLGVSVEDQATADARIPLLLQTPAAVRFVSYEPALGPVDFRQIEWQRDAPGSDYFDALSRRRPAPDDVGLGGAALDWLIVGGESGPHARPFDLAWARSAVAQCRAAGVACFVKQLGAWPCGKEAYMDLDPARGGRYVLRDRAGADPTEWPEDLRMREFPR